MKKHINYICAQATIEEIENRWKEETEKHKDIPLYIPVSKEFIEEAKKGTRITYIGKINNKIICDATVILKQEGIGKESTLKDEIINNKRVFLCAIRTDKEYENQGYFSELFHFIEKDLKKKGYTEISLSVDVKETRNLMIYFKLGFTNYINTAILYGNNKEYIFDYYYKKI